MAAVKQASHMAGWSQVRLGRPGRGAGHHDAMDKALGPDITCCMARRLPDLASVFHLNLEQVRLDWDDV